MTELETMQRAQMYIEKLANGIDPLTDEPVAGDDIINNVRISRCLFYVSDVLKKVIAADGRTGGRARRSEKAKFNIPPEKREEFEFSQEGLQVSEITRRLNALINEDEMKHLKVTSVTSWLLQAGFLAEVTIGGKKNKRPTKEGRAIGISESTGKNHMGIEYVSVRYSIEAQKLIIDNLDAVIELN